MIHTYAVTNVQITKKNTEIHRWGLQLVTQKIAVMDLWDIIIIHITGQNVRRDFCSGPLCLITGLDVWNLSQVSVYCNFVSILYKY